MSYANRHAFGVDLGQHYLRMPLLWKVDIKGLKLANQGYLIWSQPMMQQYAILLANQWGLFSL